jgi:hypothetical protein
MLSAVLAVNVSEGVKLTDHSTLLDDDSSELAEDAVQLMNARLNFADLGLPLSDQALLEFELLGRNSADQGSSLT